MSRLLYNSDSYFWWLKFTSAVFALHHDNDGIFVKYERTHV
jgi:hypothetical protein